MKTGKQPHLKNHEGGSITVMSVLFMGLLFLMVGLCVDVSRIYMLRTELQNAADAAALTAARELNSGTSGIDNAVTRAGELINTRGFSKAAVSMASVTFAPNLEDSPYLSAAAAKANPSVIRFVKVTTQSTSASIIFAIGALGSTNAQTREAVAGMSAGINTVCDFFPIAVALPSVPAPGEEMTLNFKGGDPLLNTLNPKDYKILHVEGIDGNGQRETAELAAGVANMCQTINANLRISPSSNHPKSIGWGGNSRFDDPGKNYIDPETYPPDTNIRENITFEQYKNRTAVTAPSNPGKDHRRILLAPIVTPGTYPANPGPPTTRFGAFFLKKKIDDSGNLEVEWIDETLVIGRGGFTPGGGGSSLTIAVLYK